MKFGWLRGVSGQLKITGRRLDAEAPPLRPASHSKRAAPTASIGAAAASFSQLQASLALFRGYRLARRGRDAATQFMTPDVASRTLAVGAGVRERRQPVQ